MITKEQLQELQEAYTKDNLDKGLFFLAKKFFTTHSFERWGDINGQNILNILDDKKTYSKTDMLQVSFAVFQNESVLKAYLKFLPAPVFRLIGKLLFHEEITDDEAGEYLNEDIATGSDFNKELKREYYFFSVKAYSQYVNWSNYRKFYVLSIHPVLKSLLLNHFTPPLYYNLIPLDDIPEAPSRFTAEERIQHELPRLLSYQMQQNIKYNNSGRPVEATLTKMQRNCNTTEFYANDDAETARMRNMLLAGMVYSYSPKTLSANNTEIIKDLFNNHYLRLHSPVFVLQQLKGWQYVGDPFFDKLVVKKLQDVFRLLPPDKWISIENLHEYLNTHTIDIKPVTASSAQNYLTYEGMYTRGSIKSPGKKEINYKTYDPMVKKAFISGTVFLYAAFGLFEIAFDKVDTTALGETYYSGYDGLQFMRLTPLGAYVLGITHEYKSASTVKTNKLVFDEDSLMIMAEGDAEVINLSLSNYAERVANNRFRVTSGYFLKDCKNYKNVENKINLFKKTAAASLPANWETYFNQLLAKAKAVKEQSHIKIYQLPADAKELHRFIAQDEILKKLVLKAENFTILVPALNVAEFKSRMKELGYIVE